MTREEAKEAFFQAVEDAIDEYKMEDWPALRARVRNAGIEFAHAAAMEAVEDAMKIVFKARSNG